MSRRAGAGTPVTYVWSGMYDWWCSQVASASSQSHWALIMLALASLTLCDNGTNTHNSRKTNKQTNKQTQADRIYQPVPAAHEQGEKTRKSGTNYIAAQINQHR